MHSANPAMHHLFQRITKAARTSIPLCISGEKGTGKALVAKACHLESRRNREPFLALNCADFASHYGEKIIIRRERIGDKSGSSERFLLTLG